MQDISKLISFEAWWSMPEPDGPAVVSMSFEGHNKLERACDIKLDSFAGHSLIQFVNRQQGILT